MERGKYIVTGHEPEEAAVSDRNSDISLTLNVYTQLGLQDAVVEMGRLQDPERAREEQDRMYGGASTDEDAGSSMAI